MRDLCLWYATQHYSMCPPLHVQVLDFTCQHCNLLTEASFVHGTRASSVPLHVSTGDRSQQEGPPWNEPPDLAMQDAVRSRRVDGK